MGKPFVVSCQSLEARVLKVLRRIIVGTAQARPETAIVFPCSKCFGFPCREQPNGARSGLFFA
jgi:hypothetical protein